MAASHNPGLTSAAQPELLKASRVRGLSAPPISLGCGGGGETGIELGMRGATRALEAPRAPPPPSPSGNLEGPPLPPPIPSELRKGT